MKKIILVLLMSAFMLNCSKDDAPTPSETTTQKNTRLISGTWKLVSVYRNDLPETLTSCELNTQTTYNTTNYTFIDKDYYSNYNGDCLFYDYYNDFEIQDNILFKYDGDIPISYTILTLNENMLRISVQGQTLTYSKN